MGVKIAKAFLIFVVFQLNFAKTQAEDTPPNVDCLNILLHSNCQLNMTEESTQQISGNFSSTNIRFVRLNPIVRPYYSEEFWRAKNRSDQIGKYFWIWTDGDIGRLFLSLEENFVETSLWTLSPGVEKINIDLYEVQQGCWVSLNVTEKFCTLAALFLKTVSERAVTQRHLQDSLICYNIIEWNSQFGFSINNYCSRVSSAPNIHFSLEEKKLPRVLTYKITILLIAMYFSPLIYFSLLPKRFTVRYSQDWLHNMKKFEINGPRTKTPFDELFSFAQENRASALVAVCVLFPLAHITFFFVLYTGNEYNVVFTYKDFYADYASSSVYAAWFFFSLALILILFRTLKSTELFEDWKTIVKVLSKHQVEAFSLLHRICHCEWEIPAIDFVDSSVFGDYISFQNVMTKSLLNAIYLIKFIGFHLNIRRRKINCRSLFVALLGIFLGLPTFVFVYPFYGALLVIGRGVTPSKSYVAMGLLGLHGFFSFFYAITVYFMSLSSLISIVLLTLAGAIINYEIVLPHIILVLSVIYYIWNPFHELQENYKVLKTIVFKECSTCGPRMIKSVPTKAHSTGGSNPESIPAATPLECVINREPSNSSSTAALYRHDAEDYVADTGNVQATISAEPPTPERDNDQYVQLYKLDDSGWEIIPKDLWVAIYKQLLPLDVGMAKACATSIVAIASAIFLMFTLMDFGIASELQFIGQGFASFITVSIPKLVLSFINTEGNKGVLKRNWEVVVKDKVKKYVQDNEIHDPIING